MGLRAGLDRCGKISLPPGIDPRTVRPVASRYTDCAIPAPPIDCIGLLNDRGLGICRAVPAHAMEVYRERIAVTPSLTSAIDGLLSASRFTPVSIA